MRTVWLLLFCLTIARGFTQNFHLSHYTESDGLPSNQIYHAAADTFGFLWLATRQGLTRFDGQAFRSFSQEIRSQHGKYLLSDHRGLLLSHDAGISRIIPGVDSANIRLFQAASIDPLDSALYYPGMLHRDQSNRLWISQNNGSISKIESGIIWHYRSPQKTNASFFAESPEGQIYAVTSSGEVLVFNTVVDSFEFITKVPSASAVLYDRNSLLVAGQHLHQLDLNKSGTKLRRHIIHRDLPAPITALTYGPRQQLIVGFAGMGLYQLHRDQNQKIKSTRLFSNNDPNRVDELPFKQIHQIVLFKDQQLLICSDEGFGILQNRFFETINGLPNGNINSLAATKDNRIYANFGDLYLVESVNGIYEAKALPNFPFGNISKIIAHEQHLWIGTANGKLIKANSNAQAIEVFDLSERGEGVFYMLPDQRKRLWICQAPADKPIKGIACILPNGQFKEYGKSEGLENRILVIKESPQGRIYAGGIGKQNYLYRYIPEEDVFLNISLPFDFYISPTFEVHDLTIDDEGIIWLATTDGLLRYDLDRVKLIPLNRSDASIEVRAVQNMPDGSIWCSTDTEGIIRYAKDEAIAIREESGLPSKVMSYRSLIRDNENRIWVGTAEGVAYSFDTVPKPAVSKKPLLVSLHIDEASVSPGKFKLYQDQSLVIHFNSPAYHGYRTFHQYQIDSSAWSPLNTVTAFNFEQLALGKYDVAIRSKQEGSSYASDPLIIPLKVQLRWYQQPWLRWGFSLGIVLPLFLLWLNRRRKYTKLIANLSKELNLNKARIKRRDRDLAKAKAEIDQDHRELRVTMLSLNLLGSIIHKVAPGSKWDNVLEELSIDLMRLPGVIAFEVAHQENRFLHFEGYSDLVKGFTSARVPNNPKANLAAYTLALKKPMLFENLRTAEADYLPQQSKGKNAHKIAGYESAIAAPFHWQDKPALLILYSDKTAFFDRYNLKTIVVLANYLEQITKP